MAVAELDTKHLGQASTYREQYDASLLQAIERSLTRHALDCEASRVSCGFDLWRAYEISWLRPSGLPEVAVGSFRVPADSRNLLESKSVKLYLNSFNQTIFRGGRGEISQLIARDLSALCGVAVGVHLHAVDSADLLPRVSLEPWQCLDALEVACQHYQPNPTLLKVQDGSAGPQRFYTHLFKSHCWVTGQPDWASVTLEMAGGASIEPASLLEYLVSFRHYRGFHEHCIERIFSEIQALTSPAKLVVSGHFTRRGGIDITPWRSLDAASLPPPTREFRLLRQ